MNEVPVMAVIRNFRIEVVVAAFSTYCYLKRTEKFPFKCIGMVCGNNHSNREKMKHEHKFRAILLNTHVVIYASMYVCRCTTSIRIRLYTFGGIYTYTDTER